MDLKFDKEELEFIGLEKSYLSNFSENNLGFSFLEKM